jgi:hypothetical protein
MNNTAAAVCKMAFFINSVWLGNAVASQPNPIVSILDLTYRPEAAEHLYSSSCPSLALASIASSPLLSLRLLHQLIRRLFFGYYRFLRVFTLKILRLSMNHSCRIQNQGVDKNYRLEFLIF